MELHYQTERSLNKVKRVFHFKTRPMTKTNLTKTLVAAGVTALMPIIAKLLILLGQHLLTMLPK